MKHLIFSSFPQQLFSMQLYNVWISTTTIWTWSTLYNIIVLNPSGSSLKWADYCVTLKWADYCVNDTPVWANELGGQSVVQIISSFWHRMLDGSLCDYANKYNGQWQYIVNDGVQPFWSRRLMSYSWKDLELHWCVVHGQACWVKITCKKYRLFVIYRLYTGYLYYVCPPMVPWCL